MAKKILIVDDEPSILELLKGRLSAHGFEIDTAVDGEEAIKKMLLSKPDLIIMDNIMPNMTGYQVVEKVRSMEVPYSSIPIIIISAKLKMKNLFDTVDIQSFISKPFRADDLLKEIKSAMDIEQGEMESAKMPIVILFGIQQYIMDKVKSLLLSSGKNVLIGLDEKDVLTQAKEEKPSLILCEYHEDEKMFDTAKVYKELQANADLKSIPFYLYCKDNLKIDASKINPASQIVGFDESKDLIEKLTPIFS